MHGDRKLLHFEGNWFHSVSIDGLHGNIDAFLFDTKPRIDVVVSLPTRTINPVLKEGGFHAIRYDLYPDSEVLVEWKFQASRFGPSILFLRGREAFDMFKAGDLQDVPYVDKLHEKYHSLEGDFLLKARTRSEYYFVFYVSVSNLSFHSTYMNQILKMAESGSASGSANFHVTANTVNLNNPPPVTSSLRQCPDKTKPCSLDLTSNGGYSHLDDYYLALVPPTTSEYGDLFSVRIGKSPRVNKYIGAIFRSVLFVIVFGGFIGGLLEGIKGVALILLGMVLCGCKRIGRRSGSGYEAVNVTDEEANIGRGSVDVGSNTGAQSIPSEAPPAYSVSSDVDTESDLHQVKKFSEAPATNVNNANGVSSSSTTVN
ncbi:UNVERIFIED_CONTAM: hypothetical protein HDU68_011599 [Siphonaria sp. JEL0065]|nr:hypothetical protein HDU68_011599 [Siphonaria sp. JEL0065]